MELEHYRKQVERLWAYYGTNKPPKKIVNEAWFKVRCFSDDWFTAQVDKIIMSLPKNHIFVVEDLAPEKYVVHTDDYRLKMFLREHKASNFVEAFENIQKSRRCKLKE